MSLTGVRSARPGSVAITGISTEEIGKRRAQSLANELGRDVVLYSRIHNGDWCVFEVPYFEYLFNGQWQRATRYRPNIRRCIGCNRQLRNKGACVFHQEMVVRS